MALLAYMIMVATLITSVFVGYEWVTTSSGPRMYAQSHGTAKPATRSRVAAASDKPAGTTVASADDHSMVVRVHHATAQSRHARAVARQEAIAREMAARNAITQGLAHDVTAGHDGAGNNGKIATSETALGYADAPQPPPANNGRVF
jgi:hypothetical protein